MKQEHKELLLNDLCARLPYRVVCQCDNIKAQGVLKEMGMNYNMCRLYDSFTDEYEDCFIFDCRPYLFPLSSITEEQRNEYHELLYNPKYGINIDYFDWCHKNHLDCRRLIPMGLAIDATNLNIY